nr:PREDICTED: protein FAR1-RELATED SEQUENCE 5-like [Daucus carota subsp. sativus]
MPLWAKNALIMVAINVLEDKDEAVYDQSKTIQEFIPRCDPSKRPFLNQTFDDLDSVYEFYKEYGRVCGFDIRKSAEKNDRAGNTISKYYVCSRSGSSEKDSRKSEDGVVTHKHRTRKTVSIKCLCPALIRVNIAGNGSCILKRFIEEHNHSFADRDGAQFLRCNRNLTYFHKSFIFDAAKLNIGATRAHGIVSAMTGSHENKFHDIQCSSDPTFKFEYETDSSNHLTRLFWADGINRKSYEVFGDVVSFDATYRTNKYGMVFVPLIGIDNHWKSTTFAGALLESESAESFKWLCNTMKSIFGREPKCIITDQCPAMKVALETVFPLVKHRLCMWHIMKKFPSKLGSLFCAESAFMDRLNKFVWSDHTSPLDFEEGWNEVISDFNLSGNKWLTELYDIRHSWIPAYFNDEPMLGLLRTTSRSESSNFYFNHFVQKGDTLSEFYICYDSAISRQRYQQKQLAHYDNIVPRTLSNKEIEKDAAQHYTRVMFYKIQEEIMGCSGDISIMDLKMVDSVKTVVIKDPQNKSNLFEVSLNLETHDLECSCKLFTRVGYLCSHAFFCLGISGIHIIPRQYVMNRWLKKAVERFSTLELGEISDPLSGEESRRKKLQECWFIFQSCVSEASSDQGQINSLYDSLKVISEQMKISKKSAGYRLTADMVENLIGSKIVEDITVLPPNQSNNKGCRKRMVNPAEKSLGGKKRTMRQCQFCNTQAYHDSRNCPEKKKKEHLEQ